MSFNAVFSAMLSDDKKAVRVATKRLRPGYRPAFAAWLATRPLTNPNAAPGPAYLPQYRIPQEARARAFDGATIIAISVVELLSLGGPPG